MNRSLLLTLCFAGALASPAATITLTGIDYSRGMDLNYRESGSNSSGFAGAIFITVNGTVNSIAFCVDLFTSIGLDTYNTTRTAPSTVNNGERVAWLLQNVLPSVDTSTEGSGLQLAIWDIVHDNGDGLAAGAVRQHTSPNANDLAAYAFATTYLANSAGQSSNVGTVYNNVSFGGTPAQTLMGPTPLVENPEPGTWLLMGCGVALIAFSRRKVQR